MSQNSNRSEQDLLSGVAGAEAALSLTREAAELQREAVLELKRKAAEAVRQEREKAAAAKEQQDAQNEDKGDEPLPGQSSEVNSGLAGEKPEKTDVPGGTYLDLSA
ncbi:MAG: hypothetical protein ACPGOV_08355 [Magnetovibrionaceae bacterium]